MLVSVKLAAIFSRWCASRRIGYLLFATLPYPRNSRIDSERRVLAAILLRLYAGLWKRRSEKPLLGTSVHKLTARNLQLRQVLHCDLRLLSVGGGGGFLRWCMAYPALGAFLLGSDGARVFSPGRFYPCLILLGNLMGSPWRLRIPSGATSGCSESTACW
jgi:hypothetical protein